MKLCLTCVHPTTSKPEKFLVREPSLLLPRVPWSQGGRSSGGRISDTRTINKMLCGSLIVAIWLPYSLTISLFHKLYQLLYTKKIQRVYVNWLKLRLYHSGYSMYSPRGQGQADIWICAAKASLQERRGSLLGSNALASSLYSQVSSV